MKKNLSSGMWESGSMTDNFDPFLIPPFLRRGNWERVFKNADTAPDTAPDTAAASPAPVSDDKNQPGWPNTPHHWAYPRD
jgi:hypothetical protein